MKTKFNFIFKTIASATLVAGTIVGLSACAVTSNMSTKSPSSGDTAQMCTIKFVGDPGVTFTGQTEVKVPKGNYFATVRTPTPFHGKMKFDHWSKTSHGKQIITPKTVVDGTWDTAYAVFKDETDLSKCVGMSAIENSTITISHIDGSTDTNINQDLQFSRNYGELWTDINAVPFTIDLKPGETVFFKGTNPNSFNSVTTTENIYFKVSSGGSINLTGDIMGLLDDGTGITTKVPCANCFDSLFKADGNNYGYKYVSNSFLPATQLANSAYASIFMGQKNLMTAPWLPAKVLNDNCYSHMFDGCSKIDFIKITYDEKFFVEDATPYTESWLNGVATSGTIIYNGQDDETHGISSLPSGWDVYKAPTPGPTYGGITISCEEVQADHQLVDNHPYKFIATVNEGVDGIYQDVTWVSSNTAVATVNPSTGVVTGVRPLKAGETCTIYAYSKIDKDVSGSMEITVRNVKAESCTSFTALKKTIVDWNYGGGGTLPNFKYSYDAENWFTFTAGVPVTLEENVPLYIKGNNPNGLNDGTDASHTRFIFGDEETYANGQVVIGGKINALVDDGRDAIRQAPAPFCFNTLFADNEQIVSVDKDYLSDIETLSLGCYRSMFQYDIGLTSAPALPVGKNEGDVLTDQCYLYMFRGCTSLTQAPALPAKVLGTHCYKGMFYGCIALEATPELPAEEAKLQCYYQMFTGCISLKEIGYIHLTTLEEWCCREMFYTVNETLFTTEVTGNTPFFICPSTTSILDPVTDMFKYNETDPRPSPTAGQIWYYIPQA